MKSIFNKLGNGIVYLFTPSIFVKIMVSLMLLMVFPIVGPIAKFVIKIVPIYGAIVMLRYIKQYKKIVLCKNFILLLLMCVSYGTTILINYHTNFVQNTKSIIWFVLYIGILLVWWQLDVRDKKYYIKEVVQINWIIIVINLLNLVPTVIIFILNLSLVFNNQYPIGIEYGRLFCVADGVNSSALVALVSILSSLMNIYLKEYNYKWTRKLCWLNIVCSYIFIIASATRTARYALIGVLAVGAIFCIRKRVLLKNKSKRMANGIGIGGGVCAVFVFYVIVQLSQYPIGAMPMVGQYMQKLADNNTVDDMEENSVANDNTTGSNVTNNDTANNDVAGNDKAQTNTADRNSGTMGLVLRDNDNRSGSTNHRFNIWKECIALWKENPLFGIGSANMSIYADNSTQNFQYINIGSYGASTHGMPIAVLLYSGIVGSVILALYLIYRMGKSFFVLLKYHHIDCDETIIMKFAFLGAGGLCLCSVFSSIIIFSNVAGTVLFWIYVGMMEMTEKSLIARGEKDELSKMHDGGK